MNTPMRLLIGLALLEAVVIIVLATGRYRIVLRPTLTPVMAVQSPLELALEYGSPDEKFEELVKNNTGWIPFRSQISDWPILAQCAYEKKTNYVRILLAHGADIDHAIKSLEKVDAEAAVRLLHAMTTVQTNR